MSFKTSAETVKEINRLKETFLRKFLIDKAALTALKKLDALKNKIEQSDAQKTNIMATEMLQSTTDCLDSLEGRLARVVHLLNSTMNSVQLKKDILSTTLINPAGALPHVKKELYTNKINEVIRELSEAAENLQIDLAMADALLGNHQTSLFESLAPIHNNRLEQLVTLQTSFSKTYPQILNENTPDRAFRRFNSDPMAVSTRSILNSMQTHRVHAQSLPPIRAQTIRQGFFVNDDGSNLENKQEPINDLILKAEEAVRYLDKPAVLTALQQIRERGNDAVEAWNARQPRQNKDRILKVTDGSRKLGHLYDQYLKSGRFNNLLDPIQEAMKEKIGNYKTKDRFGNVESPAQASQRVAHLLKSGKDKLYKGCNPVDTTTAREKFMNKLAGLLARDDNFFTSDQDPDPRENDPASCAIKLQDLLGADGVALYKQAIEEEKNSKSFRDAVFLNSTKYYEGPTWEERLIMWVAGPSASGKTFGAEAAINAVSGTQMKNSAKHDGNIVVSVDGGIEREVSQMRQMVLQLALKKGYPGIKDLHANTNLKLKSKVREAALTQTDLSLVIPDTFTNPLKRGIFSKISDYNKLENTKQIFGEVIAGQGDAARTRFQNTTFNLGNSRAWAKKSDLDQLSALGKSLEEIFLDINYKCPCESKNYNPKHFINGVNASESMRIDYLKDTDPAIHVRVINDMMHVVKNSNNWEALPPGSSTAGAVLISARDFSTWTNMDNNNRHVDLKEWLTAGRNNQTLGLPLIEVYANNVLQQRLEVNLNNEPERQNVDEAVKWYAEPEQAEPKQVELSESKGDVVYSLANDLARMRELGAPAINGKILDIPAPTLITPPRNRTTLTNPGTSSMLEGGLGLLKGAAELLSSIARVK